MSSKVMCIGGSKDGQFMERKKCPFVTIALEPEYTMDYSINTGVTDTVDFRTETYVLCEVWGHYYYRFEEISNGSAMCQLFGFYENKIG